MGRPPKLSPVARRIETRRRLIEAAIQLFLVHDYDSVSIRDIARSAGVTSAMIKYYFGDKPRLFEALFRHVAGPVDAERRELLAELQQEERSPSVREILAAWIKPALRSDKHPERGAFWKIVTSMPGRPARLREKLVVESFDKTNRLFLAALQHALPGISQGDLAWRLYFLIGGLLYCDKPNLPGLSVVSDGLADSENAAEMFERILDFAVAGFEGPSSLQPARGRGVRNKQAAASAYRRVPVN